MISPRRFVSIVKKKRDEIERLRSTVKYAKAVTPKKPKKRERAENGSRKNQTTDKEGGAVSSHDESMSVATEPPKKRAKVMHMKSATCASPACEKKKSILVKKMGFLQDV